MIKTIKTLIAVAALSGTVGANVQAKEITVNKGNTLLNISQVHNASVDYIKGWNNLATDLVHPGDTLRIASEKHYTVNQGDTLLNIANDNHVSAQQLIDWNDLYTNLVHPGLDLVIYDDMNTPSNMEPVKQAANNIPGTDNQTSVTQGATQPEASQASDSSAVNPVTQQTEPLQSVNNNTEATVPAQIPSPVPALAPAAPVQTPSSDVQASASVPAQPDAQAPASVPAQPDAQAPAPTPAPAQSDATKEITVKATAYTASCEGCSGITKTGVNLKANPGQKVIAVDPSVIPLGSKVYVEGYGEAIAADTGGAIKGNRIDCYMQNESDALQFGAKEVTVKILN